MTTRANPVHTFRDVIEHLVDWGGGMAPEGQERTARRSVIAAYRKTFFDFPWKYFKDDQRLNLTDDYTTGTVTYDFTGGTNEREVTIADGTWPSWAALGRIHFSGDTVTYKVAERKSTTVITLDPTFCPQEDVDAETEYAIFRCEYPLPNVHRFGPISDESGYWGSRYVTPDEWMHRERNFQTSGRPFYWTLMGGRNYYGALSIRLSGYPDEAQTLDYIATVKPRRLVVDGYADAWTTGTISSASGTSCTLSGTTVSDEVVGALIRFSRNTSVPTDVEGGNPYIDQRVITAVDDAGVVLTLDDTIDFNGVSVSDGYCISDPVDLSEELYDLLLARVEWEYARLVARERLREATGILHDAILQAREWDNRTMGPSFAREFAHPGFMLMNSQITSTSTYSGVPL